MEGGNSPLDRYILSATGKAHPRVVFLATATGDADSYIVRFYSAFSQMPCRPTHIKLFERTPDLRDTLLNQDVIYVGGGNTKSMLAVWRDWGMAELLREAWQDGVVLTGLSAGAICWFEHGVTDSWGDRLRALNCLGFLPGSCCPHYDSEPERPGAYRELVRSGEVLPGYALDDLAGAHFHGAELYKTIASKPGSNAYRLAVAEGSLVETRLVTEMIG